MLVKLCGYTPATDAAALAELPLDLVGLIFVPESPRYVGEESFALPHAACVGVFRNASAKQILRQRTAWHFTHVQLHGSESATTARTLRDAGLIVLKAIGVDDPHVLAKAHLAYPPDSVDYFLFDSPGGGSGRAFEWSGLDAYAGETSFLLAGGIGPGDGAKIAAVTHPKFAGVDLNSRFETAPGAKDLARLRKFLRHELPR